ncbi:hypothetical protein AB1Y20_009116 [Prymnesium parvum]|uniref:O-fucosyltransferase family protein n=1 Tax=Prymnesium parvum TaxID=97485 RepID=A0AB34K417_PRYPA
MAAWRWLGGALLLLLGSAPLLLHPSLRPETAAHRPRKSRAPDSSPQHVGEAPRRSASEMFRSGLSAPRRTPRPAAPRPPSRDATSHPPPRPPPPPPPSCARVRKHKLLLYAAHSGFGNQELSLRRALLVAYLLNRTLVLPPLLRQADLSFGPPEQRCANASFRAALQARAEAIYRLKAAAHHPPGEATAGGKNGSQRYESLLHLYDFTPLLHAGVRAVDFADFAARGGDGAGEPAYERSPLAPIGCTAADRYTAHSLRLRLRSLHEAAVLRLGSAYFLKLDVVGLQRTDACFAAVVRAALQLPFSPRLQDASKDAVRLIQPPFASVHVRLSDERTRGAAGGQDNRSGGFVEPELRWLKARLRRRLPAGCCSLFVASNAPGGVHSPWLAPICAEDSGYRCHDQSTLGLRGSDVWRSLLTADVLSEETLIMVFDQLLAAAAGRGFFSTSKFCGPPGYRRSTFSEGIALRWQLQRGQPPLCAHGMESALLRGASSHGAFVY